MRIIVPVTVIRQVVVLVTIVKIMKKISQSIVKNAILARMEYSVHQKKIVKKTLTVQSPIKYTVIVGILLMISLKFTNSLQHHATQRVDAHYILQTIITTAQSTAHTVMFTMIYSRTVVKKELTVDGTQPINVFLTKEEFVMITSDVLQDSNVWMVTVVQLASAGMELVV